MSWDSISSPRVLQAASHTGKWPCVWKKPEASYMHALLLTPSSGSPGSCSLVTGTPKARGVGGTPCHQDPGHCRRAASSSAGSGLGGQACPDPCYFQSPHIASSLSFSSLSFSSLSQLCLGGQTSNSCNEKRREGETEGGRRGEGGKPCPPLLSKSLASNIPAHVETAFPQISIIPTHRCLSTSFFFPLFLFCFLFPA